MLNSIVFHASLLGRKIDGKRVTTPPHVLLYGAIEIHAMGYIGCIASAETFSKETGIAENQIRRYLKELKDIGWIDYELSKTNQRGEIKALLRIGDPLVAEQPRGGRRATKQLVAEQPTSIDNSLDNSLDTSTEQSSDAGEKEVKEKISMEQVREVIDAFAVVNESYREFYGKRTQYGAAKTLIKTYPKEQIMWMIKTAPAYNKMPYRSGGDKVYTPYDLLKKWSIMKDNLLSYKIKKVGETKEILR